MNPNVPVPHDLPLPLPAGRPFLEVLLIGAFIAHILFVNLMVGGSILATTFEVFGRKQPGYLRVAEEIGRTITVNKSLAVVLGVAPLLLLNVLYTMHIYTANALTGTAWILVIPMVTLAFLLLYFHKYTWDALAHARGVHIALSGLSTLLLLLIPFVFLVNTNLMMFPERWAEMRGFLSGLTLPSVLPRYFHFMSASLVLTSLFCVAWFRRASVELDPSMSRAELLRRFYGIAFAVSLAQFVVGPVLLVSLPHRGLSMEVVAVITSGATLAIPAAVVMWRELTTTDELVGRRLWEVGVLLSLTVVCMAAGRHMYRGQALADHQRAMRARTAAFVDAAAQASYDKQLASVREQAGVSVGEAKFKAYCSGCHGIDQKVVGPPLVEIAELYGADPQGIVRWAKAPGKRRPDTPQMPSFASTSSHELGEIAKFMVERGRAARTE